MNIMNPRLKIQKGAQLFEQKFYGMFEHMRLAFESLLLMPQSFFSVSIVSAKAFRFATTKL
jgi:hypothetical protein